MLGFGKICDTFENMTDEDRRAALAKGSSVILPALAALSGGDGKKEFIVFVSVACAADDKLDEAEYKLFSEVTGISVDYATACAMIDEAKANSARSVVDEVTDFFGLFNSELKAAVISFCLCFCAADGKVTRKERKFLQTLIG